MGTENTRDALAGVGAGAGPDRRDDGKTYKWVRWTAEMKQDFLDHLASTCNITAAAAAIGVTARSVSRQRRRDKAFYRAWEEAIAAGYQMVETRLIGHCLAGGGPVIEGDLDGMAPIDRDLALRLLTVNRGAALRVEISRAKPRVARPDATDRALLKKLKRVADVRRPPSPGSER